jgi:hypothetical protein
MYSGVDARRRKRTPSGLFQATPRIAAPQLKYYLSPHVAQHQQAQNFFSSIYSFTPGIGRRALVAFDAEEQLLSTTTKLSFFFFCKNNCGVE